MMNDHLVDEDVGLRYGCEMDSLTWNKMRWSFRSIEWSSSVARIHRQLPTSVNFVLPDLPGVIAPSLQEEFLKSVPLERQLRTVAASRHTKETLSNHVRKLKSRQLLIVGGNERGNGNLASIEAIETVKKSTSKQIWAVANPNAVSSIESVFRKTEAGARGIVMQPILSSKAVSNMVRYPQDTKYVAGLALPKSVTGLFFWARLLEQPDLEDDSLFRDHCDYFASAKGSSVSWARDQLNILETIDLLSGVHFMPLNNTQDLLTILGGNQRY